MFVFSAFCASIKAHPHDKIPGGVLHQQNQPAEINAAFFGGPANQEASDTGDVESETDMDADSTSSEESSEEAADGGSDAGASAGGGGAASIFDDGYPNAAGGANARGGNIVPILNKFLPNARGQDQSALNGSKRSAGSDVAIAFGVMALIAFVVGSVVFVVKKYRHNFPVIVRV